MTMDPLVAYGCTKLRPLVDRGVLEILNPDANASEAWATLSLDIVPLHEQTPKGLTTYSVEVLRDVGVAVENGQVRARRGAEPEVHGRGPEGKQGSRARRGLRRSRRPDCVDRGQGRAGRMIPGPVR